MKTKLLFYAIQKFKKGIKLKGVFTFLIIFFMTISSFGQSDGFTFDCLNGGGSSVATITFSGSSEGDINGFPYWTGGVDNVSTDEYILFVQYFPTENDPRWEVHKAVPGFNFPGPLGTEDPPIDGYYGVLYFYSNVIADTLVCDNPDSTWGIEVGCASVSVECLEAPDDDGDGFPASVDCDDEDDEVGPATVWYLDADGDGYAISTISECDSPGDDYTSTELPLGDCNDDEATINPETVWYIGVDDDDDTFIGSIDSQTQCESPGTGYSTTEPVITDCNDEEATINPETVWYIGVDNDTDTYVGSVTSLIQCESPGTGYSINEPIVTDCNDNDVIINPGATEIPDDGIDQDCDGVDDVTQIIDFVIVAEEEVHLHGNNVVTGNVGATDYDGKIKLHEYSTVSGSIEASEVEINNGSSAGSTILAPAVVDLPPFVFNLVSNDSDFDIKVEQGQTITLNDQIYGKIEVKEGGTLIFNNSNLFIEELKAYNNTTIAFTGCTNLFINKKVKFEDNTEFNSNGESVTMYVDDDVIVEEGSNVTAFIYANKYIEAKSKDENPVSMTGFFSGKKVKGEKAVSWQGQSGYIPCEIIEPEITEEDLCDCKDGMVSLTIAYNGTEIPTTYSGVIDDNQDGTYTISNYGDKLDKDLEISVEEGELSSFATIHTSCSQEILNVTYDEAFTVISYTDNIGNTCEVNFSSKVAFEDVPQDEPVLEFKVSVWPNPTNDFFNVKMMSPNTIDKVSLNAFDINGRLIHSTIINGNEDYEFGERLQSGIYFVKISQANTTEVIKVIKR